MNHVTFETAKRLDMAGFLENARLLPATPEFGQVWYDDLGDLFLIAGSTQSGYSIARSNTFSKRSALSGCVFAPTTTDIMQALSYEHYLRFNAGQWQVRKVVIEKAEESAWSKPETMWHDTVASNQNPAEAAALAWLAMNEKK